ncbi:hypothetical protein Rsub_12959 [Raphidocelis subcapitata]|uniref:Uncharacterized protein n=1 Tax=Raphidocelis subcapitata TaxID=307507 RepID=A0A2V0PL52_9CHLO|nr:hypothetical protein Rsub_12959 [Raphidocelis subcapitata]|eukprot:GBG00280.1 hypothetical protein Rsub_12959 [Raphidocelis subcapitata]
MARQRSGGMRVHARLLAIALVAAAAAHARAQLGIPTGLLETVQVTEVRLAEIPGCAPEGGSQKPSNYLRGGISGGCVLERVMSPDETVVVTFNVAPNAAGVPAEAVPGTWDMIGTVRAIGGLVDIAVVPPKGAAPPEVDFAADTLYSSPEYNSEQYTALSGEFLAGHPGGYALNLTNRGDQPVLIILQVHTPIATVTLHPDEVEVMRDLLQRCCPPTARGKFCSQLLPAVTAPTRAPESDICRMPPTNCGTDGRLRQLNLANVGLDCGGQGLPPSFADLEELLTLDVAYNAVGGTTTDLADMLGEMPSLRKLWARNTNLTGTLPCELTDNGELQVLSLSLNPGITGTVPECLLADPSLQELYISGLSLEGSLPDAIPDASPLRVLFANGGGSGQLTGSIPSSLLLAPSFTFLSLANNNFEGAIPTLPGTLRMLNVSTNSLAALPPKLPFNLEMLDASVNVLGGSVPPLPYRLVHLNLEENDLGGPMPPLLDRSGTAPLAPTSTAGRRRVMRRLMQAVAGVVPAVGKPKAKAKAKTAVNADLPNAAAPIKSPATTPRLRFAALGLNHLTGTLPAAWVSVPQKLHTLDVSNNDLTGALPAKWDLPQLAWLDLSGNLLEGSLPASLGDQLSLVHVDLRANQLAGELGPFAETLAEGSDRIVFLDLSDNYFEGPVPADFEDATVLNSVSTVTLNGKPADRVFDISNNSFSGGPFPMWMVERVFTEKDDCGGCEIKVAVNGVDDHLACPTKQEAAQYAGVMAIPGARQVLEAYAFTCDAGNDTTVSLLSVMDGSAVGQRTRRAGKPKPASPAAGSAAPSTKAPEAVAAPAGGEGGGDSKPNGASTAGIVIGVLAGVGLLGGAGYYGEKKSRRWRQGWSKDPNLEVPGGLLPQSSTAVGSGRRRPLGAGWGSRVAARDADHGVFGVMPPAREA